VIVAALAVIGAITAGVYYTVLRPSEPATPDQQTATVTRGAITTNVSLSGSIAAESTSELAFAEKGTVSKVNVTLGQEVKAGDVLAELESRTATDALRQAELTFQAAQIKLNQMLQGATPAEKASADQSVVQAQTTLAKAEDDLKKLHQGPTASELFAAQQAVLTAESQADKAEADLDKLEDADASRSELNAARTAIQAAKLGVAEAHAKLADLTNGPDAIDVQSAQQAITAAKAGLDSAVAKRDEVQRGAEPNDIALQQNSVAQAQLNYNTAREAMTGTTIVAPFDGTIAEISIKPGDVVAGAAADTTPITLHTPNALKIELTVGDSDYQDLRVGQKGFATISSLDNASFPVEIESIGTLPSTNQGVVTYEAAARILDTSGVSLPQDGLNGAPAQVQVSPDGAAPQRGTQAEAQSGPGTEQQQSAPPAESTPEAKPQPLPGMQAQVTLVAQQRLNVLTLPIAAVTRIGGQSTVQVLKDDGSVETVQVTTGLSNNRSIEITGGLEEGQTVVLPQASSSSNSGGNQNNGNGEIITGPAGGGGGAGPRIEFFGPGGSTTR
jgi:HlyD family secretion protein